MYSLTPNERKNRTLRLEHIVPNSLLFVEHAFKFFFLFCNNSCILVRVMSLSSIEAMAFCVAYYFDWIILWPHFIRVHTFITTYQQGIYFNEVVFSISKWTFSFLACKPGECDILDERPGWIWFCCFSNDSYKVCYFKLRFPYQLHRM